MTYPYVDASDSYMLGQNFAAAEKHNEAIAAYSSALDRDPGHIEARLGRGLTLQRIGQHTKAIVDFDKVISCFPDWPGAFIAYYSRAISRYALGQSIQAIEDCNETIDRNPGHIDAIYLRGAACESLGRVEAAMADMNAVLDADPSYHEAYRVRGHLYYFQHRYEAAINDFTEVIDRCEDSTDHKNRCVYLRGMAAQQLGDHRAAIADFTRRIEMIPNDSGAYLRRSRSYRQIGEFTLADADFEMGTSLLQSQ